MSSAAVMMLLKRKSKSVTGSIMQDGRIDSHANFRESSQRDRGGGYGGQGGRKGDVWGEGGVRREKNEIEREGIVSKRE